MAPDGRQRGLAGAGEARKRARRGDARPPLGLRGCGGFRKGKGADGPGGARELVREIGTGKRAGGGIIQRRQDRRGLVGKEHQEFAL